MYKFNYISALAGAGKTYSLINKIAMEPFKMGKVIVCQPKNDNLLQTKKEMEALGLNPIVLSKEILDSDPNIENKEVTAHILQHMRSWYFDESYDFKRPMVITHAGFFTAMKVVLDDYKKDVNVYFDEVPSIQSSFCLPLDVNRDLITSIVDPQLNIKGEYYNLEVLNEDLLKSQLKSADKMTDNISSNLEGIFKSLDDEMIHCESPKGIYDKFISQKNGSMRNVNFQMAATIRPDMFNGFKSFNFMSAMFEESFLMRIYSRGYGVDFNNVTSKFNLQYQDHTNTTNTTIHYIMDDRDFSKSCRDRKCKNGNTILQNYMNRAIDIIGTSPTLVVLNNDINKDKDEFDYLQSRHSPELMNFNLPQNREIISSYVHGMNHLQGIHNIIFASALNYPNEYKTFLKEHYDMTNEEIDEGFLFASTYQAVCRLSIRNAGDNSERHIFVPDRRSADYLAKALNVKNVIDESNFMYLNELKTGGKQATGRMAREESDLRVKAKRNMIKFQKANPEIQQIPGYYGYLLNGIQSTSHKLVHLGNNTDEVFDFFDNEMLFTSDNKHHQDRLLWSCIMGDGVVDPETNKLKMYGADNNQGYTMIMFDKDDCECEDKSKDLTFTKAKNFFIKLGFKFYMYETYSGTGNFRVVLPLTHITTKEAFNVICNHINTLLFRQGYNWKDDKFGPFDSSKFNGASKFYLPNHKEGTSIKSYRHDSGDVLNPCDLLDRKEVRVTESVVNSLKEISATKNVIKKAINPLLEKTKENTSNFENTRIKKIQEAQNNFISNRGHEGMLVLVRKWYYWGKCSEFEFASFIGMNYGQDKVKEARDIHRSWMRKVKNTYEDREW